MKLRFGIGEAIAAMVGLAGLGFGVTVGGVTIGMTFAALFNAVLVVGLSYAASVLAQAFMTKPSGASVINNGRQVNTRSTSHPISIAYGEVKLGGNWVFSDVSGNNNKYLNVVITYGEGEFEGPAKDIDQYPDYQGDGIFLGGLNDLMIRGPYTGATYARYRIKIDGVGSPDTIRWSDDNGATWEATGVTVSGDWQNLADGVQFKFKDKTGHLLNHYWNFNAGDGFFLGDRLSLYYEHFLPFPNSGSLAEQKLVDHYYHLGTADQIPDGHLQMECPRWADAQQHVCYSYYRLKTNDFAWRSIPEFRATWKTRKIYDPRTSVTAYSRNLALIIYDFCTNSRFGPGFPTARFDVDSVKESANWCDANSYYFDGAFTDRQAFVDHLEEALLNARIFIIRSNGLIKLRVYTDDSPVMTLTEKDIELNETITINQPGILETPNKMKCAFINRQKNNNTDFVHYPPGDGVISAEDEERLSEIVLVGTSSYLQALKLAKFFYLRSRFNKTFTALCHPRCVSPDPGDSVQITHEYLGWTNQKVRVLNMGFQQESGLIPITFQEEDASIYDQTVDYKEEDVWISPSGDTVADQPTGLTVGTTAFDESTINKYDTFQNLSWDYAGLGVDYILNYRKAGVTQWSVKTVTDPGVSPVEIRLRPLPAATEYEWRVRQRLPKSLSPWANGANFTTQGQAGPATVSFVDADCKFDSPNPFVKWTALATEPKYYELRTEDANWGAKDIKHITLLTGKRITYEWVAYVRWCETQGLTENQKRNVTIYIKAVDQFGQYSAAADSIALTNSAPTMSGFSPTVKPTWLGLIVDWSAWSGKNDKDISKYVIYASTQATTPIEDAYIVVPDVSHLLTKYTVRGLSRGLTYDVRVRPHDIFGAGTASS